MRGEAFNDGWGFGRWTGALTLSNPNRLRPVTLPHDAFLSRGRGPGGDAATAYFPHGAFQYERCFEAPEEWRNRRVFLRFEGVFRDAVVFVNNEFAGRCPYGYGEFVVELSEFLRFGAENVVRVECRVGEDSRWYPGGGIYRPVTLFVAEATHIAMDGISASTVELSVARAIVDISVEVDNQAATRVRAEVAVEIVDREGGTVASDRQPVTIPAGGSVTARSRVALGAPRTWSVESPELYELRAVLSDDQRVLDRADARFGVRTIEVDAERGLRINGDSVLLRGACIHHDNGVLGAATFASAELRRIKILKDAGFNAIRSAHHPISRALLDACDEVGMLVMDEAFDVWHDAKRSSDYALHFSQWWEHDLEAMVRKDRIHPSVIMYSIGNEIFELGVPRGRAQSRTMAEFVRALDPTRPVTNGVNFLLAVTAQLGEEVGGALLNAMLGTSEGEAVLTADWVSDATAESFAALDVAGYNYADVRYENDAALYPDRVIVGSETFPMAIATNWKACRDLDHVIGDFTWTGWDYLGEVGIGRIDYVHDPELEGGTFFEGGWPWRTAHCGDIDIIGQRRPMSYLREIVFGLRSDPYIAALPPAVHGAERRFSSPWSDTGAIASWNWPERDVMTTVEVYADADEVELLQDGHSLGRRAAGEDVGYITRFEVEYRPGELVARAYRNGDVAGEHRLRSALEEVTVSLAMNPATLAAQEGALGFVEICLVDSGGLTHPNTDRDVTVAVEGAATLQGLGSAQPVTEEDFLDSTCRTYQGRALAVIRPSGPGEFSVAVTARDCEPVTLTGFITEPCVLGRVRGL